MKNRGCVFRLSVVSVLALVGLLACSGQYGKAADAPLASLHQRLDQIVEAGAVGPLGDVCSDADFVRRAWLDLAGVIPSAAEVRTFLADKDSQKREKLIDRLLATPQFSRHMALMFDAVFMERRPDKAVKTPEFQDYIYQSISDAKPLDQLFREMLAADGAVEPTRAASRFLLDRDCEPNIVTRDVGRVMFGMDLQCAQCHDSPLVDDYAQADYYGLYAFLFRTTALNDAKAKTFVALEKGEGEANYKSVFTGDSADRVVPRVPKGRVLVEPAFAKGDEYIVKPAKDVKHVPKFSRRMALAQMLADSTQFRRNIANRLWAHLMGRGLVYPVDNHHPANPPAHPEALTLLADHLAAVKFDLRSMLRELMLTKTYQRGTDSLPAKKLDYAQVASQRKAWAAEREALTGKIDALDKEWATARETLKQLKADFAKGAAGLKPQQEALDAARTSLDKLVAEITAAKTAEQKKQEQQVAVEEAAAKAKTAVEKVAGDKVLAAASTQIATRAKALLDELDTAKKKVAEIEAKRPELETALAAAQDALNKAKANLVSEEKIVAQEAAVQDAWWKKTEQHYRAAELDSRLKLAESMAKLEETEKANKADAERAWNRLQDEFSVRGQIGLLRPLSAEQFTFSLLQATGVMETQAAAAIAAVQKAPPAELKSASETDKPRVMAKLMEPKLFDSSRGFVNTFVGLFGGLPGQEFQATVNQALFLENGSLMETWLKSNAGNLIDRLQKLADVPALADEMYVTVMNRPATDAEREAVAGFLKDRTEDRLAAIQEMVWGLLASNEFRFIH